MNSICISNCINDTRDSHIRANYTNLYKWPESDVEFVRSLSHEGRRRCHVYGQDHPKVVDSISCRQMYLRSYQFSRKESVPQKTKRCFRRVKERVTRGNHGGWRNNCRKRIIGRHHGRRNKCLVWRRLKQISCAALFRIFKKLLSFAASVDVVKWGD
ncbi:hypothetical protein HN51_022513 [Arachis hypogaea]|uniref:Uncharacterized protein n=2 Tax=Arachis TaxID=3817 RepID=A0A445EC19_ARAHY|nr:uncharacterized protein LOC107474173 [Arachis duranensis]XP_025631184.1 uncharacterized protein LOC112724142 [Arachis hypogaea]XP_057745031.1 uncharacterized protein LOC130962892 [Arachis stenosperma]QHO53844.1 uncharacterized protein DS421_2g51550 [Arachis hypogaea]RYR72941.1 hypothetical protein Ahy_A02g007172 isoform B [Arachis hypogaea]